ncbi:hypothetical protein NESM_000198500 [Novymonas esmeraldas]|uniref:Uncharacterized protein n=1 Tax=Novymonas esmeraldas TaxID=1808958 RepID=A0AAW0F6B3_9TRYP
MRGRLRCTCAQANIPIAVAALSALCVGGAALAWYTARRALQPPFRAAPPSRTGGTSATPLQPHLTHRVTTPVHGDMDTPPTPASVSGAQSSAAHSSVERLRRSADDTLPSPPMHTGDPHALLRSTLSAAQLSTRWMLSEDAGDSHGSESDVAVMEAQAATSHGADPSRDAPRPRRHAVLVSPARVDDSVDSSPPPPPPPRWGAANAAASDNGECHLAAWRDTSAAARDDSRRCPSSPRTASDSHAAASRRASQSSAAEWRVAASEPHTAGLSRLQTGVACAADRAAAAAAVAVAQPTPTQPPPPLEMEELREQLMALLRIHDELERRCQHYESVATRTEQRHVSEKRVLALEAEQARATLSEAHAAQLHDLEQTAAAAQSRVSLLEAEAAELRRSLTEAQGELCTAMEQHLACQVELGGESAARARAEAECATLRATVVADASSRHSCERLRAWLWATEERASAAERALDFLCHQLTTASADAPTPHTPPRETVSEPALQADTPTACDEAHVLQCVVATMRGYDRPFEQPSATTTADGPATSSQQLCSAAASTSSCDAGLDGARPPACMTKAGRLCCRQHQQAVQAALARARDGYRRAAREATAAADQRAAEVEQALSTELATLRAKLELSQQELKTVSHSGAAELVAARRAHPEASSLTSAPAAGGAVMRADAAVWTGDDTEASTRYKVAAGPSPEEGALADAQRQLRHERSYVRQLESEVQSLRSSNSAVAVLEGLTETVQDTRLAVHRAVRSAVADLQRVTAQAAHPLPLRPQSLNDSASAPVLGEVGTPPQSLRSRWRAMSDTDGCASNGGTPAGAAGRAVLDASFMRGVQRAIVRVETYVEQVGTALMAGHGQLATPPSAPLAAAATASGRSAQQQRVYEEMQWLLRRSAADGGTAAAAAASVPDTTPVARYSPEGSRWMSGIRPPRPRPPAGVNVSPPSRPSPYVAAYVTSTADDPRTATALAATPTTAFRDVQRSLVHLSDATQELRNVGRLLDTLREADDTRELRQQQCLEHWHDAVVGVVEDALSRVDAAVMRVRRDAALDIAGAWSAGTGTAAAAAAEDARVAALHHPTRPVSSTAATAGVHRDDSLPRPSLAAHVPPWQPSERDGAAVSRLADVLSGKTRSGATASSVVYA